MSILVTGGCGFIGSEFVRQLKFNGYNPVVVDKLTYAGSIDNLKGMKIKFYQEDICNKEVIKKIFNIERPEIVVHFAAETHVDRSIKDAEPFIRTNVLGTQVLLDTFKGKRFIHISTDEVYGEIKYGEFTENSPLSPNSPYSASKAAADLLIKSYIRTYNFPAIIVRPCNNYGPGQYPEKFIPVIINNALDNKKIPVYGKGKNIREWLYVSDCVKGILTIAEKGKIGEVYNLGSGHSLENISLVRMILDFMGKPRSLIKFVKDRSGHDFRYKLNSQKISKLGWQPKIDFEEGIQYADISYRCKRDARNCHKAGI